MERSLMEQAGATDEQIRNAIDQGAITKQYFAQPQHVVSSLNRLRSTEIASYLQYKQHGYMAVSLLSPGSRRNSKRTQRRSWLMLTGWPLASSSLAAFRFLIFRSWQERLRRLGSL